MLSAARWWRTVHFYSRTTISVGIYWGDILRKQDVILTQRGSAGSVFRLQVIMLLLCLSVQVHSAGWSKAGLKGWRWREFRIGFWKAVKWTLFISWMFLWFSLEQPIYYHNGFVFCYMGNFYNREFLFENDHRQESNLFIYSILSCNFKKKKNLTRHLWMFQTCVQWVGLKNRVWWEDQNNALVCPFNTKPKKKLAKTSQVLSTANNNITWRLICKTNVKSKLWVMTRLTESLCL